MTTLLGALDYILANGATFRAALLAHIQLSAVALGLAALIAIPLGVALAHRPTLAPYVINVVGALRTLPSLAILALMLPILGTGFPPSLVALVVYAIPPILINAYTGVALVDADVIDAARGQGMTGRQIVIRIELPLALPVIFAGLQTAAVQVVAGATLAAFIGGGGLGDFITAGIAIMDFSRLLVGAIPVALLAIATKLLFALALQLLARHNLGNGAA